MFFGLYSKNVLLFGQLQKAYRIEWNIRNIK
jgi:hypothetical protein